MKVLLALALVSLVALPGCIYYGGGGRSYYADDHRHHHYHHRDFRGRW